MPCSGGVAAQAVGGMRGCHICDDEPAPGEALRAEYVTLVEGMLALNARIDAKLKLLEEREPRLSTSSRSTMKSSEPRLSTHSMKAVLAPPESSRGAAATPAPALPRKPKLSLDLRVGGGLVPVAAAYADESPQRAAALTPPSSGGDLDSPAQQQEQRPAQAHTPNWGGEEDEEVEDVPLNEQPVFYSGVSVEQVEQLRLGLGRLPSRSRAAVWDTKRCGPDITLSKDERTVRKAGGLGWNAVLLAEPDLPRIRVRILSCGTGAVMLGLVSVAAFRENGPNYTRSGWFLRCGTGGLYRAAGAGGERPCDNHPHCPPAKAGDVVTLRFDRSSKTLSCAVNSTECGVAFQNVSDHDAPLFFCADVFGAGASIALEERQ
eukprot:NODE_12262_length_1236_cov_2.472498.p1 GENE.NODE_12262_length_1236_cov_2.472498~~NODE_12262_length_1236_cov_2.472498.p1  ORF type:complete len:376 (+),score=102.81 NODE_12262_length_1236_cov_2.472498:49-1176(+)